MAEYTPSILDVRSLQACLLCLPIEALRLRFLMEGVRVFNGDAHASAPQVTLSDFQKSVGSAVAAIVWYCMYIFAMLASLLAFDRRRLCGVRHSPPRDLYLKERK